MTKLTLDPNSNLGSRFVYPGPNDRWIDNSSVLAETADELALEHGWDYLPPPPGKAEVGVNY